MEDYIGTKLLFETSRGVVSGILRTVEEDAGKLVVEDGMLLRDVLIEDIQRLEIIEETGFSLEPKTEETACGNVDSKTSESKAFLTSSEESKRLADVEKTGSVHGPADLKTQGIRSSVFVSANARPGETLESASENRNNTSIKSQSSTENAGKEARSAPETSEENYYKMMNRAFSFFGPLEEEFSSVAARQTYRIFSTYFDSAKARVEVIVRGDDAFSCMGLILGRLLLQSGKQTSIVCSDALVRNAGYKQSYLNSGGMISSTPSGLADIQIYACRKSLVPTQSTDVKGAMYLDMPSGTGDGEVSIGVCFGSAPSCFREFAGIVYFVDIEYPAALYAEFGMQKPAKSKIYKLK